MACTLIAIALSLSRGWRRGPNGVGSPVRRAGRVCCALLFVQLGVAAVMRHSFAGLAIPTFPASNPRGGLLPDAWNFRIGFNFTHRVMAGVIVVAVLAYAIAIWRDRRAPLVMRAGASALVSLLALQILLGAAVIRTYRNPEITTGHVLVGAVTLVTAFWLTWMAHRDALERADVP
jgi:cytochrome c oxidase assembly protein subunit 15